MKLACAFVGLAVGCGVDQPAPPASSAPPPVVTAMSPTSGPFGTEVTIDGTAFGVMDPLHDQLVFKDSPAYAQVPGADDACGFELDSWTDTEITGRVLFPCTAGSVVVRTAGGMATAGTFTPDAGWAAGPGLDISELVDARALSTGVVVATYRQFYSGLAPTAGLAVFDGSAAGAYGLPDLVVAGDTTSPVYARVVETDDHAAEVIGTQLDGTIAVFTLQAGTVTVTPTGLDGQVVAAARDDAGVYAWIYTAGGLSRARPGTPWTIDRGPFGPEDPPLDAAVAADGTLWISMSESNNDPIDYEAWISLQSLAPAATQLSAIERADPTSYDDVISKARIVLADDGVHMVVVAARTDTGSGLESAVTPRQRTAANTWVNAPTVTDLVQYAFVGTTLAAVASTDAGTSLIPDLTAPAVSVSVPVWPLQAESLVATPAGQLRPLLGGNVVFAPTPP